MCIRYMKVLDWTKGFEGKTSIPLHCYEVVHELEIWLYALVWSSKYKFPLSAKRTVVLLSALVHPDVLLLLLWNLFMPIWLWFTASDCPNKCVFGVGKCLIFFDRGKGIFPIPSPVWRSCNQFHRTGKTSTRMRAGLRHLLSNFFASWARVPLLRRMVHFFWAYYTYSKSSKQVITSRRICSCLSTSCKGPAGYQPWTFFLLCTCVPGGWQFLGRQFNVHRQDADSLSQSVYQQSSCIGGGSLWMLDPVERNVCNLTWKKISSISSTLRKWWYQDLGGWLCIETSPSLNAVFVVAVYTFLDPDARSFTPRSRNRLE